MSRFTLTFYGTRGTRTVSGPQYAEFGGHTTCVVIEAGERKLVFDSGSGIVGFGKDLVGNHFAAGKAGPIESYLFHTHCHYDHICGFPYYAPLYIPNSTTWIFGPRNPLSSFEQSLRTFVHTPYHPVPLYEMEGELRFGEIREPEAVFFVKGKSEPVVCNVKHSELRKAAPSPEETEVVVRCLRGYNHPKSGVMFYRVEYAGRSVVLATDTEGYVFGDRRLARFATDASVLIHDAMYTKGTYTSDILPTQGWGHSTVRCALRVGELASVNRIYLVHHDPNHGDDDLRAMEADAQAILANAEIARDGTVIDLLEAFPPA